MADSQGGWFSSLLKIETFQIFGLNVNSFPLNHNMKRHPLIVSVILKNGCAGSVSVETKTESLLNQHAASHRHWAAWALKEQSIFIYEADSCKAPGNTL